MESNLDLRKLATLIKDIKFPMFTTVNDSGDIISRPMANQEIDEDSFDGRLWFFTKRDTAKVHSIAHDSHVNLAYSNPDKNRYVSLSGRAMVTENKEKMQELWNPMLKAWFPEGLEDPEICLIAVDISSAEVWDSPSSKLVQAVGYFKAIATGESMDKSLHSQHLDINRPH